MSGGTKYDDGKPDLSLLSSVWLLGVGAVLSFGKKKYSAHNWRNGLQQSRLIAAAMRHIVAFNDGEDLDPETGLPHLHHASCCLMFASEMWAKRPDMDDRFKMKNEIKENT